MRSPAVSGAGAPELINRQPQAAPDANNGPRLAHSLVALRMRQPLGEGPIEIDEAYSEPEMPDNGSDPTQLVGSPIQVDEDNEEIDEPLKAIMRPPNPRRLRQRTSTLSRAGSRQLDRRLEDMIANETQCHVRSEPRPPPLSSEAPSPVPAEPEFLEPDPEYSMPSPGSDNNTSDMADFYNELRALAESSNIPLRYASTPGGIRRKYTVGGISLRYQRATDAAMRAPTVVRNRPRMRRRSKTRNGSTRSSRVQSPATSSAASPRLPPPNVNSPS
ncbi:hypothetical protein VTH82DRAFT_1832 [Thermothelomyces myriococcoides]